MRQHFCLWAGTMAFAGFWLLVLASCSTPKSLNSEARSYDGVYRYIASDKQNINIQLLQGKVLVWFPPSDLTENGRDCSDAAMLCAELDFGTIVLPRRSLPAAKQWSANDTACDRTSVSARSTRFTAVCRSQSGSRAISYEYVDGRGVTQIYRSRVAEEPTGWDKLLPLVLVGNDGLFKR